VSASWVQPSVTCKPSATYSAFWVGLDGATDKTVEQTGTEADCAEGSPRYYGWYEMYPAFPRNYSVPVVPGDHMSASVTATTATSFMLTLTDATQGLDEDRREVTRERQAGFGRGLHRSAVLHFEGWHSASGRLRPRLVHRGGRRRSGDGDSSPVALDMGTKTLLKDTTSALTNGSAFTETWDHS
jgi:hypothetical protein